MTTILGSSLQVTYGYQLTRASYNRVVWGIFEIQYNGLLYCGACTTSVKLTVLLRALIKERDAIFYKTRRGYYDLQSLQSTNTKLLPYLRQQFCFTLVCAQQFRCDYYGTQAVVQS